MAYKLE